MKKILGLDLGTNSIGWAVVNAETQKNETKAISIEAAGSRIIPMDAEIMGKFEAGNSISQTAERSAVESAISYFLVTVDSAPPSPPPQATKESAKTKIKASDKILFITKNPPLKMLKIMIIFIVIVLYHFPDQKATTFPRLERIL